MRSPVRRLAAEFGGTAFLLAVVVGSGIMAQRLSGGNMAVALLANSIATGAGLYALITALAPSGANFNPAVTLLSLWQGQCRGTAAVGAILAQFAGAVVGVLVAHVMFDEQLVQVSATDRSGWNLAFSEFLATLGLLATVTLVPKHSISAAVATYITAAYWFTASTSFANPAVTLARALTASFAGIGWSAVPGFMLAQILAVVAMAIALSAFARSQAKAA